MCFRKFPFITRSLLLITWFQQMQYLSPHQAIEQMINWIQIETKEAPVSYEFLLKQSYKTPYLIVDKNKLYLSRKIWFFILLLPPCFPFCWVWLCSRQCKVIPAYIGERSLQLIFIFSFCLSWQDCEWNRRWSRGNSVYRKQTNDQKE